MFIIFLTLMMFPNGDTHTVPNQFFKSTNDRKLVFWAEMYGSKIICFTMIFISGKFWTSEISLICTKISGNTIKNLIVSLQYIFTVEVKNDFVVACTFLWKPWSKHLRDIMEGPFVRFSMGGSMIRNFVTYNNKDNKLLTTSRFVDNI